MVENIVLKAIVCGADASLALPLAGVALGVTAAGPVVAGGMIAAAQAAGPVEGGIIDAAQAAGSVVGGCTWAGFQSLVMGGVGGLLI